MTPGQQRNFWRATTALREAETLADMPAHVSGPADEPPRQDSDVQSWLSDWGSRAKRTLQKASEWATAPERFLKDRAKRAFRHLQESAHAVRRAAGKAADVVTKPITQASNTLTFGILGFDLLATVVVGYVAYRLFLKKG